MSRKVRREHTHPHLGEAARQERGADMWLFGYGSLMWNPAIDYAEHRAGWVRGWHRRFCSALLRT